MITGFQHIVLQPCFDPFYVKPIDRLKRLVALAEDNALPVSMLLLLGTGWVELGRVKCDFLALTQTFLFESEPITLNRTILVHATCIRGIDYHDCLVPLECKAGEKVVFQHGIKLESGPTIRTFK